MLARAKKIEDSARNDFEKAVTLYLNPHTRDAGVVAASDALGRLISGATQRGDRVALARYIEYWAQIEALRCLT